MILHFQRFGINIDDWPEPNANGTYPNDDDNSEKPDEIDVLVTDEDVDDTGQPDDDEDLCESTKINS